MSAHENSSTANFRGLPGTMAAVFGLLALLLGIGGGWLLWLGGSAYYLTIALGLLMVAVLLLWRQAAALWLYALLCLATLVWSVWEAGLDWWQLAPRLDLFVVLGLPLLLPAVWRTLRWGQAAETPQDRVPGLPARYGGWAVAGVLMAVGAVSLLTLATDPYAVQGSLPPLPGQLRERGAASLGVPPGEWHAYGRTGHGQRYVPLDQITPDNVGHLQLAWEFHTGDLRGQPGDPPETTFEVTPLKIGALVYLCTPHQDVIALNATTGRQVWRHETQVAQGLALQHRSCRGLGYKPAAAVASAAGRCAGKLYMPTVDGRLLALDPDTGTVCSGFGDGGAVDLWAHMPNKRLGAYYSTSPPVVTQHLVIVGGTVLDNVSTQEQSGVIRAFDADSGALVWHWDSGHPDDTSPLAPGQTYTVNSPNSWSIGSVDEVLGLVYLPLGNQPPDQWGGRRSAAVERFSSSVVALDLKTGRVRWVFQTVHHDLWDYDVPAQPSLVDLQIGNATVPALVQPTKQGELFVLDRRTGTPLLPVTEVAAPHGAAAGDHTAETQPVSALSFDPPRLRGRDMWGGTPLDQLWCRIAFHRLRYSGRFTPPSMQGSLVYPGNFGVFNWGGVAIDPYRQIVFATPTRLAFVSKLVARPDNTSLVVNRQAPEAALPALNENFGAPFAVELKPFTSPLGLPCQAPPWGLVAGADLISGRIAWRHRNGTVRDLSPVPLPFRMGVPNLGGPIVTASGLAFLSGTLDDYLRAYDVSSGKELWRSRLPAGGQATPMSYLGADGRQYLLVVAGGHGSLGTRAGDSVLAYALPGDRGAP
jgi:quinoprotein glucose dehydrogenase